MKNVMIILGVIVLMEFIGKIFIKTLGNKRFLIYTISLICIMIPMSASTIFFHTIDKITNEKQTLVRLVFPVIICSITVLVISYFIFRGYTKKQDKVVFKEYFSSFIGQFWLASLIVYLTLILFTGEFFGLVSSVNSIVKFCGVVLSVCILFLSFTSFSKICMVVMINKLLKDDMFSTQIEKQKKENGFIITGKEITSDFLFLLDFKIYWVLNRSNINTLKPDETAFIKVSDEAMKIYEKLIGTQRKHTE